MRFPPFLLVLSLFAVLLAPGTVAVAPVADGPTTASDAGTASDHAAWSGIHDGPHEAITSGTAATAETTPEANASNQTHVLVVPGKAVQVSTIERVTLDLGPSAEFSGNVSAVRMENAAVESYVVADGSDRGSRIEQSLDELETNTETLQERQVAAIKDYNRGALTTQEFVVELATISAKAELLEERVTVLKTASTEVESWSDNERRNVRTQLESTRYQLRALGGPVSERAVAAIRGTEPPTRVFVATGPEGYELATIDNGSYIREAYRGTFRKNDPSARIEDSESTLSEVFRTSYPRLLERRGEPAGEGSGTTFVLTNDGEDGNVTAFVDSATESIFKEYQYLDLESYTSASTVENVQSGLRMTISRTYPGGPVKVNVTDAKTGDPVNTTITLSQSVEQGQEVGRTGDDGVLWTISPRGEYSVFAFRSSTSAVVVETNTTEPPSIN